MNDMNQSQQLSHQAVNQPLVMNQAQVLSQSQIMNQPQMMNQAAMISHQPMMKPPLNQPQMMNRSYGMWPSLGFQSSNQRRSNWKGKKGSNKLGDTRRKEKSVAGTSGGGVTVYKQPPLHELQSQNRLKARKFHSKRKGNVRFAPLAPRNTTSFIIRAKKAGGIASLVSPCPVTPAVLPTPIFSPSREVLVDMAKEEWGVDGYGSMKGLIRLRSPEGHDEEEDEVGGGGSSESDVEEHVEVERRLAHDLSRFEMIYPNYGSENSNILENRVDHQDSHIAQLVEENLTLKERLFLMERELGDLKIRLQCLERQNQGQVLEDINEEVMENVSENETGDGGDVDAHSLAENRDDGEEDDYEVHEKSDEDEKMNKNGEDLEKMNMEKMNMETMNMSSKDMEVQHVKEALLQTVCTYVDDNGM